MNLILSGYRLGVDQDVVFLVQERCLIPVSKSGGERNNLRTTMANLLTFLLDNAVGKIVSDRTIMIRVWDNHGLRSSAQRLWQVMGNLIRKLRRAGLPDNMIIKIPGQGYLVQESMVSILYSKRKSNRATVNREAEA